MPKVKAERDEEGGPMLGMGERVVKLCGGAGFPKKGMRNRGLAWKEDMDQNCLVLRTWVGKPD